MITREMTIEALTVCVDYSDYLAETLPHLLPHVDHLTVVTATADRDTQALCRRYGVRCLPTDCMYRGGAGFDKARAINYGLANLRCKDWILHVDADIALPPATRKMLMNADLRDDTIYGVDRVNCPSYAEWRAFLAAPGLQYEWSYLVRPPRGWPLGGRVAHGAYGGYVPIGFFQLWHGSRQDRYPEIQAGSAEHTDLLHAIRWERDRRALLPEVIAMHLADGVHRSGANWQGRRTARFGPSRPERGGPPGYPGAR